MRTALRRRPLAFSPLVKKIGEERLERRGELRAPQEALRNV